MDKDLYHGEMGLQYPEEIEPYVASIASFLDSQDDLLRERSLNALGRIGRIRFETVKLRLWIFSIVGMNPA